MKRTLCALAALAAVSMPAAALAGRCGGAYCWGAVGVGPNGEWGYSYDFGSESGAIGRVQDDCPGCTQINSFHNTCGAMATGSDGAYGFGWAPTRAAAEQNALGFCSDYGFNCQSAVWACSP